MSILEQNLALNAETHPPCEVCIGPIIQYPSESPAHWLNRKTCCRVCANKLKGISVARTAATNARSLEYHWPVVTGENWPGGCFSEQNVPQSVIDRKDPRDRVSDSRFCRSPTDRNRTMGGVQTWACR